MTDHPLDDLEEALADLELMLDDDAEEHLAILSDTCIEDLPKVERVALDEEVALLSEEIAGNERAGH